MIVHKDIIQGSEEWEQIRLGRATASQASNILTPTGKLSTSRFKYARKLARECRLSDPMEFQGNKFTDWGNEHESEARELFQEKTGLDVMEVGFCTRQDGIIGCSPDGLIGLVADMFGEPHYEEGLEIKCPQVDKHVEYLLGGELPSEYKMQVHWSMATTGLNAWWFMSYFPETNPLIIKVERDEFTEKVSAAMDDFIIDYKEQRELVLNALFGNDNESK